MKIVYLDKTKIARTDPRADGPILGYEFTLADGSVIEIKEDADADSLSIRVTEGSYHLSIQPVSANQIIVKGA